MRQITELTEARAEILMQIAHAGGDLTGMAEIARRRDVSRQTVAEQISKLKKDHMIKVTSRPNGNLIELTEAGWQRVWMITGGNLTPDTDLKEKASSFELYSKRLHGVVGRLTPLNRENIPDGWRARIQKRSDLEWIHVSRDDVQDQYVAVVSGFTVQLHRKSVTVHLRQPIEAWSVQLCIQELADRLERIRDRIERATGIKFSVDDVELGRQEVGIEKHHLAMLVDRLPQVDLQDVWVEDPDQPGRKEIKMDKSPGAPELETMGKDRAVEVADLVEDELRQYSHHPSAVLWRHKFEKLAAEKDVDPEDVIEYVTGKVGEEEEQEGLEEEGAEKGQWNYEEWNQLDKYR